MPTYSAKFNEQIDLSQPVWTLSTPGSSWQYHESAQSWVDASSFDTFAEAAESMFAIIFVYYDYVVLWVGWTEGVTEEWNWRTEAEAIEGSAHFDLTEIINGVSESNAADFVSINKDILKAGILEQIQQRTDEKRTAAGLPVHDGGE